MLAELPGDHGRMVTQPRIDAAHGGDDSLDLGADVVEGLVRVVPHVVFDRAVVGCRAGVREEVEPAVAAAAGPADDDRRRERVEPRRQDRMRLRVRPLALELLERGDELDRLLDRVDAAAAFTTRMHARGASSKRAPRRPSTSMRKWTSPPSAAQSRSSVGSSERVTSQAGARSTISRVPFPTTSSSLTTWKTMSPRGRSPWSSATLVAHIAAARPPFMSVAPRP